MDLAVCSDNCTPPTHTLSLFQPPYSPFFLFSTSFCPLSLSLYWIIDQLSCGWAVVCASVCIPQPQQNHLPWEWRMCVKERKNWTEWRRGKKEWGLQWGKVYKADRSQALPFKKCVQCQCMCKCVNVPLCVFVWEKHGKQPFLVQIKPD